MKKETQTIDQTLKVILTDAEKLSAGMNLADRNAEIDELENALKAVGTEYKMKIAAAESARSLLSSVLRSGYEYRPVPCTVTLGEPDESHKTITRNDTGEAVAVVGMTPEEMQRQMDFEATEARHDQELVALPTDKELQSRVDFRKATDAACAEINAGIDATNSRKKGKK